MQRDAIELGAGERPALVEDRVRDSGRPEFVQHRGPAEPDDLPFGGSVDPARVRSELRAATTVAGTVWGFQVDEVGRHGEGRIERGALQRPTGFRLEIQHGLPWIHPVHAFEPNAPVGHEQVREFRVVRPVATVAGGIDRLGR